jgi:uncharacterized protein (UPF0371 family)
MPSLGETWDVLKPILEVGAVGAMLLIMIRFFKGANSDLKTSLEDRLKDEKEHSKAIMKLQIEHNKEVSELTRKYDETLVGVSGTLDKLSERLGDS